MLEAVALIGAFLLLTGFAWLLFGSGFMTGRVPKKYRR